MRSPFALIAAFAVSGLLAAGGCASTNVSPDRIAAPKAKIAAAEEAGAKENPDASLHLKLANDQYERATKMMKEGDEERAERMLERASADAELALELARLDTTRGQANDAMKSIDQLRQEHRMLEN